MNWQADLDAREAAWEDDRVFHVERLEMSGTMTPGPMRHRGVIRMILAAPVILLILWGVLMAAGVE